MSHINNFKNCCSVVDLAYGRKADTGREPVSVSLSNTGPCPGPVKNCSSACYRVQLESEQRHGRRLSRVDVQMEGQPRKQADVVGNLRGADGTVEGYHCLLVRLAPVENTACCQDAGS